jgi:hypothetical protein
MLKPSLKPIQPNAFLRGSIFPELVKVIAIVPVGESAKLICEGMVSGKVHQPILTSEQLELIEIIPADNKPFNGDATKFRIGIEAFASRLAQALSALYPPNTDEKC